MVHTCRIGLIMAAIYIVYKKKCTGF